MHTDLMNCWRFCAYRISSSLTLTRLNLLETVQRAAPTPQARHLKRVFETATGVNSVAELIELTPDQKRNEERGRYVTFQMGIVVTDGGAATTMCPRTLEEAFTYQISHSSATKRSVSG
ncbi:MAG: hypothetical protein IPI83_12615 [Sphingomonadales bacterium]|nr:hypothetical protein [Sphingomonadales bacterium]